MDEVRQDEVLSNTQGFLRKWNYAINYQPLGIA